MAILTNKRGQNGQETTPVAISTAFWNAMLKPVQKESYSDLPYNLYHVTHADLDLMIILHKICNTTGKVKETTIHQIYQAMKDYFESPASHTQVYLSMEKFIKRGLVTEIKDEYTNLSTFQLNYFIDETTDKPHRYVAISEVVFTAAFSSLTLAARKLFLLTAIQQGDNEFIFRSFRGENGLLKLLHKNQPSQVQDVLDELKGKNAQETVYFRVAKTELQNGRYHKVYLALHKDVQASSEPGQELREPLNPPVRYPRKATFIERVLHDLGIGEAVTHMNLLINCLKKLGYRVIRQVLRTLKEFFKRNGHFPRDLAYFIKKETRISREKEICDLAHEAGIFDYIAPGLHGQEKEHRIFEFVSQFSWYSTKELRRIFKASAEEVKKHFDILVPKDLERYEAKNNLSQIDGIYKVRLEAFKAQISPEVYRQLEDHVLTYHLNKGVAYIQNWLFTRIEREAENAYQQRYIASKVKLENVILHQYESAAAAS